MSPAVTFVSSAGRAEPSSDLGIGTFIRTHCSKINTELVSLKIYKTNFKTYYKNTTNLYT